MPSAPSKEWRGVWKSSVRSVTSKRRINPLEHPLPLRRRHVHPGKFEGSVDASTPPIFRAYRCTSEARESLRSLSVRAVEGRGEFGYVLGTYSHSASLGGVSIVTLDFSKEVDEGACHVTGDAPDPSRRRCRCCGAYVATSRGLVGGTAGNCPF